MTRGLVHETSLRDLMTTAWCPVPHVARQLAVSRLSLGAGYGVRIIRVPFGMFLGVPGPEQFRGALIRRLQECYIKFGAVRPAQS